MVTKDAGAPALYIGQAGIAREFGVTRQAVSKWRGQPGFPVHDVEVDGVPGWLAARLPEVREWLASGRPGQGAGGGRPRKEG